MLFVYAMVMFVIVIVFYLRSTKKPPANPFNINGVEIWRDRGKQSKPFFNGKYYVLAKPDHIYQLSNGAKGVVEFKSRYGEVFDSDVAQTLASVLAVRPTHNIKWATIYTKNSKKDVSLGSDAEIWQQIKHLHENVLIAKSGKVINEYNPNPKKCDKCAMKLNCQR